MDTLIKYFLFFAICSVFGWIGEVIYCSIYAKKRVSRGFLVGPYCPIYGFGALLILLTTQNVFDSPILVFLNIAVVCSALEYLTSYIMEKVFHARWWDYSHYPYNINGRICLKNTLIFGIGGSIAVYSVLPVSILFISSIPIDIQYICSLSIALFMMADFFFSSATTFKTAGALEKVDLDGVKDYTATFKKYRREMMKTIFFSKRSSKKSNKSRSTKKDRKAKKTRNKR